MRDDNPYSPAHIPEVKAALDELPAVHDARVPFEPPPPSMVLSDDAKAAFDVVSYRGIVDQDGLRLVLTWDENGERLVNGRRPFNWESCEVLALVRAAEAHEAMAERKVREDENAAAVDPAKNPFIKV